MRKLLVAVVLLVTAGLATGPAVPAGAAKGGWAVASFDPLPALVAGRAADVSFRLLQHGVHPVEAADWPQVHLDVTGPDGTASVPARAAGGPGRFTARITAPESGHVGLTVVWPGGLLLESNAIDVPVATPGRPAGGPEWWPIGLATLAAAAGALVVADVIRGRTRRPELSPAAP